MINCGVSEIVTVVLCPRTGIVHPFKLALIKVYVVVLVGDTEITFIPEAPIVNELGVPDHVITVPGVAVTSKLTGIPAQVVKPPEIVILVGIGLIVTDVVTGIAAHPPLAGMVYVTVYTPAVLVLGVIAPVVASILNPAVEEKTPPVNAPLVPENVTGCTVALFEQNGEAYVIAAVGAAVIITLVVAVCKGQPLEAAIV